ncbi:MAG: glycosyltransferase [Planctomycetales bacterium]|nr:glycosyltransferase [Planctomycetales bacterium]
MQVAYWTSAMHPDMEAVASEVALLRKHFFPSVSWGISADRWLQLSWRRGFGVHPRLQLAFRATTWALQRTARINHLFGSGGDWFHLRALHSHPALLTATTQAALCNRAMLAKIDHFVVEWPGARESLQTEGIPASQMDLIFPPVDVHRFFPSNMPAGPLRVLFASSPGRPEWLEARGIPLLLEVAQRLPDVRFRLLWRPWGTAYGQVLQELRQRELSNVELYCHCQADMAIAYREAHVTIAPFTDAARCKAVPNSLLESLASGRPVILTDISGIAELVQEEGGGIVCPPQVEALCAAVQRSQGELVQLAAAARRTAEKWFSAEHFLRSYQRLYAPWW